jgi:hypothetical protein
MWFPKGNKTTAFCSVYLENVTCGRSPTTVDFELTLRNSKAATKDLQKEETHFFTSSSVDWGFREFLELEQLNDPARGFRGQNGEITFHVLIRPVQSLKKAERDKVEQQVSAIYRLQHETERVLQMRTTTAEATAIDRQYFGILGLNSEADNRGFVGKWKRVEKLKVLTGKFDDSYVTEAYLDLAEDITKVEDLIERWGKKGEEETKIGAANYILERMRKLQATGSTFCRLASFFAEIKLQDMEKRITVRRSARQKVAADATRDSFRQMLAISQLFWSAGVAINESCDALKTGALVKDKGKSVILLALALGHVIHRSSLSSEQALQQRNKFHIRLSAEELELSIAASAGYKSVSELCSLGNTCESAEEDELRQDDLSGAFRVIGDTKERNKYQSAGSHEAYLESQNVAPAKAKQQKLASKDGKRKEQTGKGAGGANGKAAAGEAKKGEEEEDEEEDEEEEDVEIKAAMEAAAAEAAAVDEAGAYMSTVVHMADCAARAAIAAAVTASVVAAESSAAIKTVADAAVAVAHIASKFAITAAAKATKSVKQVSAAATKKAEAATERAAKAATAAAKQAAAEAGAEAAAAEFAAEAAAEAKKKKQKKQKKQSEAAAKKAQKEAEEEKRKIEKAKAKAEEDAKRQKREEEAAAKRAHAVKEAKKKQAEEAKEAERVRKKQKEKEAKAAKEAAKRKTKEAEEKRKEEAKAAEVEKANKEALEKRKKEAGKQNSKAKGKQLDARSSSDGEGAEADEEEEEAGDGGEGSSTSSQVHAPFPGFATALDSMGNASTLVAKVKGGGKLLGKLEQEGADEESTCQICFDAMAMQECRPCLHRVCRDCMEGWRRMTIMKQQAGTTCPFCRQKVESLDAVNGGTVSDSSARGVALAGSRLNRWKLPMALSTAQDEGDEDGIGDCLMGLGEGDGIDLDFINGHDSPVSSLVGPVNEEQNGFIFMASRDTYRDCLDRALFGAPSSQLPSMRKLITQHTLIFLLDFHAKNLYGPFEAVGEPQMNIEDKVRPKDGHDGKDGGKDGRVKRSFPAQLRVRPLLADARSNGAITMKNGSGGYLHMAVEARECRKGGQYAGGACNPTRTNHLLTQLGYFKALAQTQPESDHDASSRHDASSSLGLVGGNVWAKASTAPRVSARAPAKSQAAGQGGVVLGFGIGNGNAGGSGSSAAGGSGSGGSRWAWATEDGAAAAATADAESTSSSGSGGGSGGGGSGGGGSGGGSGGSGNGTGGSIDNHAYPPLSLAAEAVVGAKTKGKGKGKSKASPSADTLGISLGGLGLNASDTSVPDDEDADVASRMAAAALNDVPAGVGVDLVDPHDMLNVNAHSWKPPSASASVSAPGSPSAGPMPTPEDSSMDRLRFQQLVEGVQDGVDRLLHDESGSMQPSDSGTSTKAAGGSNAGGSSGSSGTVGGQQQGHTGEQVTAGLVREAAVLFDGRANSTPANPHIHAGPHALGMPTTGAYMRGAQQQHPSIPRLPAMGARALAKLMPGSSAPPGGALPTQQVQDLNKRMTVQLEAVNSEEQELLVRLAELRHQQARLKWGLAGLDSLDPSAGHWPPAASGHPEMWR